MDSTNKNDSFPRVRVLAATPDPAEAFGASRSLVGVLDGISGGDHGIDLVGLFAHTPGWVAQKGVDARWRVLSGFSARHSPWHRTNGGILRYLRFVAESLLSVFRFWLIIRRIRPDLVYVNTIEFAYPVLAARIARVPVVVHVRETPEYFVPKHRLDFVRLAIFRRLKINYICNSRSSEGCLHGMGVDGRYVVVVHNAIDADFYSRRSLVDADLLEVRVSCGAGPLVVCVSRLSKEKGIVDLVRAFKFVLERFPTCRLVICGGDLQGPYFRKILAPELTKMGLQDFVQFHGQVADPRPWLASAEVVVVPSHVESFGRVVLEAMAMQKAVVATRVGGIPEVVEEGETALLVPAADPDALAGAVCELLGDPERRDLMACAGRMRAESVFSMRATSSAVAAVMRQAVGCAN